MQHDAPDHFAVTQHNIIMFTTIGAVVAAGWFENQIHQEKLSMSEEALYGESALEQSHGYTPMADPTPEPPAVPDYDDAIAAAEELTRKREAETPIITRDYIQLGGDHAGEPVGDNETVDARRAARDLAKIREVEAAETQLLKDAELAREVDELRGQQTQQPEQLTEQQTQPEAIQADTGRLRPSSRRGCPYCRCGGGGAVSGIDWPDGRAIACRT